MPFKSHFLQKENHPGKVSGKHRVSMTLASVLALAVVGLGGRLAQSSISASSSAAQTPAQTDRLVVQELLTLRRSGFDPAELTIPSGNFMLAVDNLTDIPDIALTLSVEKKNKIKEVSFTSRNRDWRGEIDLQPGVYVLSEASHPEWTCRITVTDKVRGR